MCEMCSFAQDKSETIRCIGDGGHGIRMEHGDCALKKKSSAMQAEIYNHHVAIKACGSLVGDYCPFYQLKNFDRCKYYQP